MAVAPDMLYAMLSAIIAKREKAKLETGVRQLRAVLEWGHASAANFMDESLHLPRLTGSRWFTPEPVGSHASCWINPVGLVFPIAYAGHSRFAMMLTGIDDPEVLIKSGWVHVSDTRIDIEYDPTARQQAVIDRLVRDRGFRIADTRPVGYRKPLETCESLDPRLSLIGPLQSYDWQSERYWEARGIPRVAHNVRSPANNHVQAFYEAMQDRLFDGNDGRSLGQEQARGLRMIYAARGLFTEGRLARIAEGIYG